MHALTITEYVPVLAKPNLQPRSPKRQRSDYAARNEMIRSLKAVIRPGTKLRYQTLEIIGVATARYRNRPGDAQSPAIIAGWMIDYLLEYIIEVQGVAELGQYTGDVEEAIRLGMPHAYALIATTYHELAPYCGTQGVLGMREAKAFCIG